jgi:asparagine synthase (glutamine-hydrolysing)
MPEKHRQLNQLGDFLVAFARTGAGIRGRTDEEWFSVLREASFDVMFQEGLKWWRGFPARSVRQGNWHVWLLGEVFGAGSATETDQWLLDVVEGRRKPDELNGHFLLFGWNEAVHEWHVWTDRFGTLHAYYGTDGTRAALGTFCPSVASAASNRHLDWEGLTGFMGFGFFQNDRTHFDDVKVLRPASHYVFDEMGTLKSQCRYWNWWYKPAQHRSYDDTIEEFRLIFAEVIRDQTRHGRLALPISGGLDSRTIASFLGKKDGGTGIPSLWSYSYGYRSESEETEIAKQVAGRMGLQFQPFTIGPYLFDQFDEVVASTEGFQDVTICRQAAVLEEIRRNADFVIGGHLGDLLMDDMGHDAQESRGGLEASLVHEILHKTEKRGSAWLLEKVCQPQLKALHPVTILSEQIKEGLKPLEAIEDPDFRLKADKIEQWCFRWTSSGFRMYQPAAFLRLPFYDTRLVDFFCTVPRSFVRKRRLQVGYLKRHATELARVKWQAYDTNLFHYKYFNSLLIPKRTIKHFWRSVNPRREVQRNWEVQFLCRQGREGLANWLLSPGLRLHELVPKNDLEHLVRTFFESPLESHRGYTISMLLTFSGWLQKYV